MVTLGGDVGDGIGVFTVKGCTNGSTRGAGADG